MAYELAEQWGIPDVETWRRSIEPAVLTRWIVYYRVRATLAKERKAQGTDGATAWVPQSKAAELFASVGKRR